MLKCGKNDKDSTQDDANDADNKSLVTEKSVEKQLFTESAIFQSRNASSISPFYPQQGSFYFLSLIIMTFL